MKYLQFTILLCFPFLAFTQTETSLKNDSIARVELVPQAPGCDFSGKTKAEAQRCVTEYVLNYVAENYKYPEMARQMGVEGKVHVNFVVEKDGTTSTVEIVKSNLPDGTNKDDMEAEAIRIVEELRFEKPAYLKGKPVRMSFTLPINLGFEKSEEFDFWGLFRKKRDTIISD